MFKIETITKGAEVFVITIRSGPPLVFRKTKYVSVQLPGMIPARSTRIVFSRKVEVRPWTLHL